MKQLLRDRFLPLDYDQILFHKYQRCSRGSQNVNEYTAEFLHLAEQNNLHEIDGQQVARYVEGLKPIIRNRIGLWMLNVTDAWNMVLKAWMLMQDRINMRFDYQIRFPNAKLQLTPTKKSKLP